MNLEIREEAVEDLRGMEKQIQELLRDRIEELKRNPLGDDSSLFRKQGLDLFRLKLKREPLDHRVFYDIEDGTVSVYGVMHRDEAYTDESLQRIKERV